MATEIRVPTLGESVSEATIGRWFKKPGEAVKADEPLVELETDKVTLEVNAPTSGVLSEVTVKDGETVGVGALLGQIDAEAAVAVKTNAGARNEPSRSAVSTGKPETQPTKKDVGTGAREKTDIRVPTLGESVSEATVGRWFKAAGDAVRVDEPLVELETDKVTLEVNAPVAGVLSEISVKDGASVEPGAVLGKIQAGGNARSAGKSAETEARDVASRASSAKGGSDAMPPAPSAAKLATEQQIDLSGIEGSGRRGQVLKGDVLQAAAQSRPRPLSNETTIAAPARSARPEPAPPPVRRAPSPADDSAREERVRMTKLRQTIARRLKDAQNTAAMLTTFNEVDMSGVMALRTRYKDVFEKKHGAKLGFMGLFVKACVGALKELPAVNAEIDGADIVYKNYYHIGIAVGTDKGLVVPVVRDADQLGLAEIEKTIADFGRRARDGHLTIDEMQRGTFTITNGGIYGSLMSTPILNAPQSGILGMHKIQDRPVAVGGKIEIRPMMYLALSYDHRIIDGREAVTFLVRVKDGLEDPARLMLEV